MLDRLKVTQKRVNDDRGSHKAEKRVCRSCMEGGSVSFDGGSGVREQKHRAVREREVRDVCLKTQQHGQENG